MMNKIFSVVLCTCIAVCSNAQPASEQQAIKKLCGCFEVSFKYAETFAADENYVFHPRYQAAGLEWVAAVESAPNRFVLQHLLLVDDSMVVKHWREDWEFERNTWLVFDHDAAWHQVISNKDIIKGQWTQTVWEVDDAPRYQGSSKWINSNGKYYWENTVDAPLPRREYSKRKDYNVMQRTNRITVTDTGWVHEQDNRKLVRKQDAADSWLADEKGFNIYRKTDDSRCKQAAAYWEKHKAFWNAVRLSWTEQLKDRSSIQLQSKADGLLLYQQLEKLEKEALTAAELKLRLFTLLKKYM